MPDSADAAEDGSTGTAWRRVLIGGLSISAALTALSLLLPVVFDAPLTRDRGDLRVFTWVHEEGNLPTWWSVSLLVCASLGFLQCGLLTRRSIGPREARSWWLLAAVAAGLSLDELTSLHERLDGWGLDVLDGGFAFGWILFGVPIAVAAVVVIALAVRRIPPLTAKLAVAGVAVLMGSAVGFETIGGVLLGDREGQYEGADLVYTFVYHLEEFGEMTGATLLLCAAISALSLRRVGAALLIGLAKAGHRQHSG